MARREAKCTRIDCKLESIISGSLAERHMGTAHLRHGRNPKVAWGVGNTRNRATVAGGGGTY